MRNFTCSDNVFCRIKDEHRYCSGHGFLYGICVCDINYYADFSKSGKCTYAYTFEKTCIRYLIVGVFPLIIMLIVFIIRRRRKSNAQPSTFVNINGHVRTV
jgi:hypothetical protein